MPLLSTARHFHQLNKITVQLEVLAVKHFRPYLYRREFTLRDDHASLQWLYRWKELSRQVARWLEILSEFQFELIHRSGVNHGNADGLSRVCNNFKQCQKIEQRDGGPTWGDGDGLADHAYTTSASTGYCSDGCFNQSTG